jgi:hypothetical protein
MNPIRLFLAAWRRLSGWFLFLHYKIKQRRSLKKQKNEDPNIYPMS